VTDLPERYSVENRMTTVIDGRLESLLQQAWQVSRERHGYRLSVHVPGMFVVNGMRGKYRAISITGDACELDCEHCKGSLLRTMPAATDASSLLRFGMEAAGRGDYGMLVTGGCDRWGRLPWKNFLPAISRLKGTTDLTITVHAGQVDGDTALALKEAGVDQALVDLIGDDRTAREIYHLPDGAVTIRRTLDALTRAGLETIPHILFGLHYGMPRGETVAVEMLKSYPMKKYVIVVLMPAKSTPMAAVSPPRPEIVADFIARARLALPDRQASLGCARPRGPYSRALDVLAVRGGINALALPSDRGLEEARCRGLEIVYRETCCSLG